MATVYTDEWIAVGGVWLHYQDWAGPGPAAPGRGADRSRGGRGAAPESVLLLHGLTQQSHVFDALARRLAPERRCVALDLRGRGESAWAPGTYTVPQYVADVLGILDALGLDRVHVVGTSLGGLIGLSLAARAPSRLRSLVLNDIGPEIDPRGAARVAAYATAAPARFATFDAACEWALAQYPWLAGRPREEVEESVRWAVRRAPDGGWRLKFDPTVAQSRAEPAAVAAARAAWWRALEALPAPVLLVRGAQSDILSEETAAAMQARRPTLARVDVPGVGHAPTLVEPAAWEALRRFYGSPQAEGGAACASC